MKDELLYQCCICGNSIYTKTEPSICLIAIKDWNIEEDEHTQQEFFCHEDCFKKVLQNPDLYYLQYT